MDATKTKSPSPSDVIWHPLDVTVSNTVKPIVYTTDADLALVGVSGVGTLQAFQLDINTVEIRLLQSLPEEFPRPVQVVAGSYDDFKATLELLGTPGLGIYVDQSAKLCAPFCNDHELTLIILGKNWHRSPVVDSFWTRYKEVTKALPNQNILTPVKLTDRANDALSFVKETLQENEVLKKQVVLLRLEAEKLKKTVRGLERKLEEDLPFEKLEEMAKRHNLELTPTDSSLGLVESLPIDDDGAPF